MSNVTKPAYIEAEGTDMTGKIPVIFELEGVATGKRRNEVKVWMTEPQKLQVWDLASDEAPFHGGDESAPEPLGLFIAGVVTCFMTQMRTFARHCGVTVRGLKTTARFEWSADRHKLDPYIARPVSCVVDITFDTSASLEEQKVLIRTAAKSCFAEQILSIPLKHRLWFDGRWEFCEGTE